MAGALADVKFPRNQREPGGRTGGIKSTAAALSTPREGFEPSCSAPSACPPLLQVEYIMHLVSYFISTRNQASFNNIKNGKWCSFDFAFSSFLSSLALHELHISKFNAIFSALVSKDLWKIFAQERTLGYFFPNKCFLFLCVFSWYRWMDFPFRGAFTFL